MIVRRTRKSKRWVVGKVVIFERGELKRKGMTFRQYEGDVMVERVGKNLYKVLKDRPGFFKREVLK